MSNAEQQIIISSLAYIVFDVMGKKVKEKEVRVYGNVRYSLI